MTHDLGRDAGGAPRFYGFLKAGKLPQTSQINAAGYMDFFEKLLQQGGDVLHIAFTSGQSCSVNNAYLAGSRAEGQVPRAKADRHRLPVFLQRLRPAGGLRRRYAGRG